MSCSVVRRVLLPDAFFAADGAFQTLLDVLDGLRRLPRGDRAGAAPLPAVPGHHQGPDGRGAGRGRAGDGPRGDQGARRGRGARHARGAAAEGNDLVERLAARRPAGPRPGDARRGDGRPAGLRRQAPCAGGRLRGRPSASWSTATRRRRPTPGRRSCEHAGRRARTWACRTCTGARSATCSTPATGDLVMVASRTACRAFDVVMAEPVPDKGRVLTAMSAYWFDELRRRDRQPPDVHRPRRPAGLGPPAGAGRPGDAVPPGPDAAHRVHRAGLRDRLGVEGVPGAGHDPRHGRAPGPGRGRPAARADVHAIHQGRGRRPRREHHLRPGGGAGGRRPGRRRPGGEPGACTPGPRSAPRPRGSCWPTPSSSWGWWTTATAGSAWWSPTRC